MTKRNRYKKLKKPARKKDISLVWRAGARSFSVGLLFATIFYGITAGGYVKDPNSLLYNVQGRVAGQFGYAAQEIRIAGLKRQSAAGVLRAIKVRPNDSLIGFSPATARAILEKVDWVQKAQIRRIYPNQLEIDVIERVPFAIWQRDGEFYVIDKSGSAFTSVEAGDVKNLLVVTGEGAHEKVFDLVNHLEAHLGLRSKIAAAGRIGNRRWNLYLKNGLKVMLPEKGLAQALVRFERLQRDVNVFDKAVASLDLRLGDRIVVLPIKGVGEQIKVSQK